MLLRRSSKPYIPVKNLLPCKECYNCACRKERAERYLALSSTSLKYHQEYAPYRTKETAEKGCQQDGFPSHQRANHRHHLYIASAHSSAAENSNQIEKAKPCYSADNGSLISQQSPS